MTYSVGETHVNIQKNQSDHDSPDPKTDNGDGNSNSKENTPKTTQSSSSELSDLGGDCLSFTARLRRPWMVLEICHIPIDEQRHPFLSSFLLQRRYTNIPFGTAHRLLNYIMHLLEEAVFDFLMLHTPGQMTVEGPKRVFKWRTCADELEVHWWVEHLQRHYLRFSHLLAGEGYIVDLNDLRLFAIHSWVYSTHQVRTAVGLLATLKDEKRLGMLEKVLETTYWIYRNRKSTVPDAEKRTITDAEKRIFDVALGFIPTEPTTIHQLLCRVQELLENACYNWWKKHNPQRLTELEWHFSDTGSHGALPPGTEPVGWDCPERVELQIWHDKQDLDWSKFDKFPPRTEHYDPDKTDYKYLRELLRNAVDLRNCAAHRFYDDTWRPPLEEILEGAWKLAAELEDDAAADEIEVLQEKDFLQPIYEDQKFKYERRRQWRKEVEAEARADWEEHIKQQEKGKEPDTEDPTAKKEI